jgi:hypothetical protein
MPASNLFGSQNSEYTQPVQVRGAPGLRIETWGTRLDRYREGGIAAIAERSRRPHLSPDKTADELERRVVLPRPRV